MLKDIEIIASTERDFVPNSFRINVHNITLRNIINLVCSLLYKLNDLSSFRLALLFQVVHIGLFLGTTQDRKIIYSKDITDQNGFLSFQVCR